MSVSEPTDLGVECPEEIPDMDVETIQRIRPSLTRYLHEFDGCFVKSASRRHMETYVTGQLSGLQRKSVEPMADAAGVPPRTLQEFLSLFRWDEEAIRDRLQRRVARRHAHPHSVGILDETSFVKKGQKTAGVQRQFCGSVGKTENCVISVHLGYATPDFHTLLDGELYLPETTWHEDRERCREAGIPDDVVYRPKWRMALDQIHRAYTNGVRFGWLTFDEGYGGKPPFLRALDEIGQNYVGEIPSSFHVWTTQPALMYREHQTHRRMGRPRKLPRLRVQTNPTVEVRKILTYSPILRRQSWEKYHIKDGVNGPIVWEAKRILVWMAGEDGLPTRAHHLVVARNVLDPNEVKYFLSNAPEATPVEVLLLVAFSRWRVERMFEDSKGELGMDHFEVRRYVSIKRHLIVSCVSHLFLAEFWLANQEKKNRTHDLSSPSGDRSARADLVPAWSLYASDGRVHQPAPA